jgi:predicted dehydrogenase
MEVQRPMTRKRYAQVGVGDRSRLYLEAMAERFADTAEVVALCDRNEGRLRLRANWLLDHGVSVTTYPETAFEQMIAEAKPDIVIVTTPDATHDTYICRAMELGCDVITEKPMTTDEQKCQRILDTQRETERRCRVTFNYRYAPPRTQVKEILMSGAIGDVISVDFHWLLDTHHGADYFRRWHRNKRNSGGLLVHKATHHFDLINWWLSTVPERVYATGGRNFYLPETAKRYGFDDRAERCLNCPEAERCPFYLNLRAHPRLKAQYLENEVYDGYFRDRCVFSDKIDIEDTMGLLVNYRNGAMLTYSLHAFMPWEGYVIAFNGSKGRLEHKMEETIYISGDGSIPGEALADQTYIRVKPHAGTGYEVEVRESEGGHGGADPIMLQDIFDPPDDDPLKRAADYRAGAWSILTGVAGNHALEQQRPIRIEELIHGLEMPDYPAMPDRTEPIDPLPFTESASRRG